MDSSTLGSVLLAVARRWWLALLVFVAVIAADMFYTTSRVPTYLARVTLIISPGSNVDRGSLVYSVDSLGRGRVVGTYAAVLGSELLQGEALEQLGYSADELSRSVTFRSSVVSDAAVIQLTAESPDPRFAASAANKVGELGIVRLTDLYPIYNLSFLSKATPPTAAYRPDAIRNYGLGMLFGFGLALVLAYVFDRGVDLLKRAPDRSKASDDDTRFPDVGRRGAVTTRAEGIRGAKA